MSNLHNPNTNHSTLQNPLTLWRIDLLLAYPEETLHYFYNRSSRMFRAINSLIPLWIDGNLKSLEQMYLYDKENGLCSMWNFKDGRPLDGSFWEVSLRRPPSSSSLLKLLCLLFLFVTSTIQSSLSLLSLIFYLVMHQNFSYQMEGSRRAEIIDRNSDANVTFWLSTSILPWNKTIKNVIETFSLTILTFFIVMEFKKGKLHLFL